MNEDAKLILRETALAVARQQVKQQQADESLRQLKNEQQAISCDLLPDLNRRIKKTEKEIAELGEEIKKGEQLLDMAIDNLRNKQ